MAKNTHDDAELSKDERKRLEKLGEGWGKVSNKPFGYSSPEKITLFDLRLLLEHFPPLRELIRQVAAPELGRVVPGAAVSVEWESARDEAAEAAQTEIEAECDALQTQLNASQHDAADLRRQLAEEQQRRGQMEQEVQRLRQQLEHQTQALARQRQQQSTFPPGVALLGGNSALAVRLGLTDLPGDATGALIRVVAVLAQMSSIERLWDALKENCERERRPASAEEVALLQTALDWHNHNWSRKPFALHRPVAGAVFDFNKEQRAVSTPPTGETLSAVWLPGIMASSGSVQKKALVATL
ncbi:AAA family ATPase [Vitreoscilla filiformis]|nr:hypothetical protein [Vitreoscilla filiformis]